MAKEYHIVGDLNPDLTVFGKDTPRVDATAKVTGQAVFAGDVVLPRMLVGKLLRSPYAHAKMLSIDTSEAEKLSGVKAVVTGKDHPGKGWGPVGYHEQCLDNCLIQPEKARFFGDAIAAVAAVDEDTAMEALQLIKVDWEVLPPVLNEVEAYKEGASAVHDHVERNVSFPVYVDHGDVEKGFEESDVIINFEVSNGKKNHAQIEPLATVASYDKYTGKVTVWTSTQSIFKVRLYLSEFLQWPVSKINVVRTYCGGGFGGKLVLNPDLVGAVLLSKKAGRPVKIVYSREEHTTAAPQKHGMTFYYKAGFAKDGKIKALDVKAFTNTGGYADYGAFVLFITASFISLTYVLENYRFDGRSMYTNTSWCGPHRGFGNQQSRFGLEQIMDMAADKLGITPDEIRLRNLVYSGYATPNDWRITTCGLKQCIEEVVKRSGYREKRGKLGPYRGVGLGVTGYVTGARIFFDTDSGGAFVKLNEDGTVSLVIGNAEIGQGADTAMCQIAAETLGVSVDKIIHKPGDTDTSPYDLGSYGSRTTFIDGNAVIKASEDAKSQLFKIVADKFECSIEDLESKNNMISVKGSPSVNISFEDAVSYAQYQKGEAIYGRGYYDAPTSMPDIHKALGNIASAYVFGAAVSEVEVDPDTGQVKVVKHIQAQDVGYPVSPMACEGQMEGSILGAMGQILYEDYRYNKDGVMVNPSLLGYRIPTAKEVPDIESVLVVTDDPEGPFGAKGMSECPEVPVIGAIANAIYDAIGVNMTSMPVTPDKILKALRKKKSEDSKGS